MTKQIKDISHKLIDSLSDGVFSIALTLLGLDVVSLVPVVSHSKNFNTVMADHWPTFLAYILGFVVLFSMWYTYHTLSQYVVGTNTYIVWNHGLTMAWVAIMPFGVALLADNLNTSNRKWGVFYFGVCLFGQYWTASLQNLFVLVLKTEFSITFTEDMPLADLPLERKKKILMMFSLIPALLGVVLVSVAIINPWIALIGFSLFIFSNVSPVRSINRLTPFVLNRFN